MNMDNLEEYIRKHREEMDRYKPSSGAWRRIRKALKTRKNREVKWISIAAMVTVILGTAVVFLRPGNKRPEGAGGEEKYQTMMKVRSQLKEAEIYYNNLANSLYREATPMLTKNPEIGKELDSDISQIDSICSEIKKDLKDNVANQDVIEALIQNYRIKIRLLEDMLQILKENEENPEKSNSHEL
jgi:hypothetical protein